MIPTSKLPAKLPMGQLDIFIKREKKHNIIHPLFFHFAKCQTPCDPFNFYGCSKQILSRDGANTQRGKYRSKCA